MAVLDKSTQDKIDEFSNKAYDLFEAGEKEKSYQLMEDAWSLYPEPASNWNESYNTARYALDDLLKEGLIERAMIWYNRMTETQNNLNLWEGSYEFYSGKVYFEKGDYKLAVENFRKAFKIGGGRYFEDEDPKYKDFYLHPEKYMDKE